MNTGISMASPAEFMAHSVHTMRKLTEEFLEGQNTNDGDHPSDLAHAIQPRVTSIKYDDNSDSRADTGLNRNDKSLGPNFDSLSNSFAPLSSDGIADVPMTNQDFDEVHSAEDIMFGVNRNAINPDMASHPTLSLNTLDDYRYGGTHEVATSGHNFELAAMELEWLNMEPELRDYWDVQLGVTPGFGSDLDFYGPALNFD
jgi:hypothetical protein